MNVQHFTVSGTFTVPAGVTELILLGQAGGDGGTSGTTNTSQAASGTELPISTLLSFRRISVVPNTTYTIIIGDGGTGGVATGADFNNGTGGEATYFGGEGFFGGARSANPSPNFIINPSRNRDQSNAQYASGSQGSDSGSYFGGGGSMGGSTGVGANGGNGNNAGAGSNGSNATTPGTAGGFGGNGSTSGGNGGNGAPGQLYVIWVD